MKRLCCISSIFCFTIGHCFNIVAAENITIPVASGDEIVVERYPASGEHLIVWFAPEYGFREAHRALARGLGEQHIEVWQTNLLESLFLPDGANGIRQLDGTHVADLVEYAHNITGKKIILAGDSYAALTVLTGARRWQERRVADRYFLGAVLFSPYTYAYIPELGMAPEYMPIVSATNIPLLIFQAQNSAIIGQFDVVIEKLRQHGNPVYYRIIPNVMSLFYQQPPTGQMQEQARSLPVQIRKMFVVLEQSQVPDSPISLQEASTGKSGIDLQLKPFSGNHSPIPIALPDIHGNTVTKTDYAGKVTVINFWATWCPPCIEEIPSLNRLQNKMQGFPFEIISINYAEEHHAILEFMRKVNIEFPVLLDRDGEFARQWNVISYPSTFVIDSGGKIRFGVNAAINWDTPELIEKMKSLSRNRPLQ